jgi:hypothetical protein
MDEKTKKPTSVDVLSRAPKRDTYGPDHGSGNPHMNWDDKPLNESETWKSHASRKPAKEPNKSR